MAVLAGVMLLSACGGPSEQRALAAGKAAFEQRNWQTAVIELKNALAANPKSPEARFMLGKALLEAGDYRTAEIELRKAKELQIDPSIWAPAVARAMLLLGQNKQLLDEFRTMELSAPAAQVDLDASVAAAMYLRGDAEKAQALIERGLVEVPQHPQMLMLKARLLARPGTLDEAVAIVAKLGSTNSHDPEVWGLLGDLQLFGKRNLEDAGAAYRKVLSLQPQAIAVQAKLVYVYLAGNKREAAREQLAVMRKVAPRHPQTLMIDAQISFQDGDALKARDLLRETMRAMPDHAPAYALAGAVELQQKSLLQAETFLTKSLTLQPNQPATRRLLADTLIRSGKAPRALEVLRSNLERSGKDVGSLTLAGEGYLQVGDFNRAEAFFKQATQLAPEDARLKTAIALTHMSRGQVEVALAELRAVASAAPDALADVSLVSALMRRHRWPEALKAIDGLERKQPEKPLASHLRGQVLSMQKDLLGARRSFEQALQKDPVYFPAVASLASLDVSAGKPQDAQARYEAVIKTEPGHTAALLALAELRTRRGHDAKEILALLQRAVQSAPLDSLPRVALVRYWIHHKDSKAALAAAQGGASALPDSPELLELLGALQLGAGEANQAVSTLGKVVTKWPTSADALVRLAEAQMAAKDLEGAEKSFRKALELAPESQSAQRGVIAMSLSGRRPQAALQLARSIQKQRPDDPTGYQLEGDILADGKNWDGALKAYHAGIDKAKLPGRLPVRVFSLLLANQRDAEAERFGVEWASKRPSDSRTLVIFGGNALNASRFPLAERMFELAVAGDPKYATALNNLSWVKAKLGKPGGIELAERALVISPNEPPYLDTLAFAQAAAGRFDKAIETEQAVIKLVPTEPIYRLNLARIYLKAGRKADAKGELVELAKLGEKFARQKEVGELLAELK